MPDAEDQGSADICAEKKVLRATQKPSPMLQSFQQRGNTVVSVPSPSLRNSRATTAGIQHGPKSLVPKDRQLATANPV